MAVYLEQIRHLLPRIQVPFSVLKRHSNQLVPLAPCLVVEQERLVNKVRAKLAHLALGHKAKGLPCLVLVPSPQNQKSLNHSSHLFSVAKQLLSQQLDKFPLRQQVEQACLVHNKQNQLILPRHLCHLACKLHK